MAKIKVKLAGNRRYFEDDTSGFLIRLGQEKEIEGTKMLRSKELRYALMKNQLLMIEGELEFVWGTHLVKVCKGNGLKNNIIDVTVGAPVGDTIIMKNTADNMSKKTPEVKKVELAPLKNTVDEFKDYPEDFEDKKEKMIMKKMMGR